MSDLIERLHKLYAIFMAESVKEAIDALEAKDKEIADMKERFAKMNAHYGGLADEIERLEAALTGSNGALTRMDRARNILLGASKTGWEMLNTADIRQTLGEKE